MTTVWTVSHSEQLIADCGDSQFIENPVFAKAHHDHVTVLFYLQMAIAEYAFRLALVVGRMTGPPVPIMDETTASLVITVEGKEEWWKDGESKDVRNGTDGGGRNRRRA